MGGPKVYLAAPWKFRKVAKRMKDALVAVGVNVISTWVEQENTQDDNALMVHAARDFREVRECDVLFLLNYDKSDGKATEMGMAVAMGKPVYVLGGRKGNIFYHLPEVVQVANFEEAARLLR